MIEPRIPTNDYERSHELEQLRLVHTPPEEGFDRITRLVKRHFHVPYAMMSMVYRDEQFFKSVCGLNSTGTARNISFCGHVVANQEPLVVEDPFKDPRFADNPLVLGEPKVRFYAGAPIFSPRGLILGSLCIVDILPRQFSREEAQDLQDFVILLENQLKLRETRL